MIIALRRGVTVDPMKLPEDFEQQVQEAFREYTKGTAPEYRYQDKLKFIDDFRAKINRCMEVWLYATTENVISMICSP